MLVSCDGSFEHGVAHIVITPVKWFPEVAEMIFGKTNGFSTYVEIGIELGRILLPNGLQLQKNR